MSTADLTKATRELFVRTRDNQVYYRTPLVEELRRRNQITYKGGKYIEKLADTATTEDHWQEYSANDPLTDQKTSTLDKPRFLWKLGQYPLRYDVDEELQNVHAGNEEQLLDLAQFLSEKAQADQRLWLCAKIFNSGSTTAVSDGGKTFQSLISALDHDNTYGTITRSLSGGTNDWWQGADPSGLTLDVTSSGQDTAYNLTKSNLRKWINETDVSHYMDGADDLQILMCPTLWNKLAAELESHTEYKGGLKQSQGIRSMVFDGHEIVSVPYLQRSSTMKTWLFICNLRYLELRIHSNRNFIMKDFKWQGENANGYDYWLARILVFGNVVCWKPNSSLWLSNVS
jgi:hypothetical protein